MSVKAEHYDVIRKPIITEKATMASESGAVVFEVAVESTNLRSKKLLRLYLVLRLRRLIQRLQRAR